MIHSIIKIKDALYQFRVDFHSMTRAQCKRYTQGCLIIYGEFYLDGGMIFISVITYIGISLINQSFQTI